MPAGKPAVLDSLQKDLSLHWGAAEAYQLIGEHLARWGYGKLGDKYSADAEEERGHIAKLVGRLEFFDAPPGVDHVTPAFPRRDFVGILDVAYRIENEAAACERAGYAVSLSNGDPVSASLFLELLDDSEDSIREIEATRLVIEQVGLDNFLANQIA